MNSITSPPHWTYPQIRTITEKVLTDCCPVNLLPIPIEEIVELKIGIKLNTSVGLKTNFDIDGFTHTNFEEITLDDYIFNTCEERTRFTLAHELGHIILHKDIYQKFDITDRDSYIAFQNGLPEDDRKWMEIQANMFAGCILVPSAALKIAVLQTLDKDHESFPVQADSSIATFEKLPIIFKVSSAVIYRRLQKEGYLKEK